MKSLLTLLQAVGSDKRDLNIDGMSTDLFQFSIGSGLASYLNYCSQYDLSIKTTNYLSILKSAELTAKIITNTQLSALDDLLHLVTSEISEIILLKGIIICQTYYPCPHFRIMSDIDILVSKENASIVDAAIISLGYVPTSNNSIEFYRAHHHSTPFFNKLNNVWIEVHTHIFSGNSPSLTDPLFEIGNIFDNCVCTDNKNYSTNTLQLKTEIQLIYCCSHLAEDLKINRSCLQLIDIILLIKNRGIGVDWDVLFMAIDNTASASYVYLFLSYFKKNKVVSIPDDLDKRFSLKHNNMGNINLLLLHFIIDNFLLGKKTTTNLFSEANITIVWNTLIFPSSSLFNLFKLPWNLIFPPENNERYRLSLFMKRIKSLINR